MRTFGYYLSIGAIAGVLCAMFEWPIAVVWIALFAFFIFSAARMFYIVTRSQNVKAIGRFIAQNKRDPIYLYLHELGNGSLSTQREALNQVLTKYGKTKYGAAYGALLGMLNKDYAFARQHNEAILHSEEGQFNAAAIDILAGKKNVITPTFKKPWMEKGLEAYKAYAQKDVAAFEQRAQETLALSKGIQYYGNYYRFEQMKQELTN